MLVCLRRIRILPNRFTSGVILHTYHDESFGFRKPPELVLPDCECPPNITCVGVQRIVFFGLAV
jgi:hypothetical protein